MKTKSNCKLRILWLLCIYLVILFMRHKQKDLNKLGDIYIKYLASKTFTEPLYDSWFKTQYSYINYINFLLANIWSHLQKEMLQLKNSFDEPEWNLNYRRSPDVRAFYFTFVTSYSHPFSRNSWSQWSWRNSRKTTE